MKRRWFLWLLVILVGWLVAHQSTELKKLIGTLANGQWLWILAAALLQALYFVGQAGLYRSALAAVEVSGQLLNLLRGGCQQ